MKRIFIILLITNCSLLIPSTRDCYAQSITWQRLFPDYYGVTHKVQQIYDGGYIALGSVLVNSVSKIRIIKFNLFGDTLWTKIIGAGNTQGYWIEQTTDKGFIIGGNIDSGLVDDKVYLVKTDSLGNIIWNKSYSGLQDNSCLCVRQIYNGGYILLCASWSNLAPAPVIWLFETDYDGNLKRQNFYGDGITQQLAYEIQELYSGYVAIGIRGTGINMNAYLMKFNLNGDTLWTRSFGGNNIDYGKSIISPPSSGSYVISGYSKSFNPNNKAETYVVKTDTNGILEWQRTYSNLGWDYSYSVRYKPNLGYILAGSSDSLNTTYLKAKLRLIDFSGNILLERTYNPVYDGDAEFFSIELTSDGGFIIGGYNQTSYNESMYVVKTDSTGFANPIGINNNQKEMPGSFKLYQNFPNPFNSATIISYDLKKTAYVRLAIFDVTGKKVMNIDEGNKDSGEHYFRIDLNKFSLSSGTYFYSLYVYKPENHTLVSTFTKKMIYLK